MLFKVMMRRIVNGKRRKAETIIDADNASDAIKKARENPDLARFYVWGVSRISEEEGRNETQNSTTSAQVPRR